MSLESTPPQGFARRAGRMPRDVLRLPESLSKARAKKRSLLVSRSEPSLPRRAIARQHVSRWCLLLLTMLLLVQHVASPFSAFHAVECRFDLEMLVCSLASHQKVLGPPFFQQLIPGLHVRPTSHANDLRLLLRGRRILSTITTEGGGAAANGSESDRGFQISRRECVLQAMPCSSR